MDKRKRFVERAGAAQLVESEAGVPRRLRAVGITANVVNGNGRRYPSAVLEAAVQDLRTHLHESAGQGRAMLLLGEAEHPSDKGGHPSLLETVVRWDQVAFDGAQVILEGTVLETSKGRDILALLEGGVTPDVSQRGYGTSVIVKEDGKQVEEVTALTITGYDLVVDGADPNAGITMVEATAEAVPTTREQEERPMDLEELRKQYPNLVKQIEEEHDAKRRAELEEALRAKAAEDARVVAAVAEKEAALRKELGLKDGDDLAEALHQRDERLRALEAAERQRAVEASIDEQVKDVAYPDFLKGQFVEAVKAAKPASVEEAKAVIAAKRKEYDTIMAGVELQKRGFGEGGVTVTGPVIEREVGVPAFAGASWAIQESLQRTGQVRLWNAAKPSGLNEAFAVEYLRKYDEMYKQHLLREAREWQEAEQTTDMNLPYSVMRAIVAEAFPDLVATSIFDVAMTDQSPMRLYFEAFSGETGYVTTVTDESVTADLNAWVQMANRRINPGTVVVTNSGATVTYTEGTDYVIDYEDGKIEAIATITDGQSLLVDYTYTPVREGEMTVIPYGKMTLSYQTLEMVADRLAQQISREAVVFSRSQIGWDAVTRTLASITRQLRRKIDEGLLYKALGAVLTVSSNSGGTYTHGTTTLDNFIAYIGLAKVKVLNRYYQPTAILTSVTNADRISNWDGFKTDGFPDATLNANGFVGRVKGLPMFQSTEFSDGYVLVMNRELVMHRVYQPMRMFGPYPSYDITGASGKLISAEQYYVEEFNGSIAPVAGKGSYVKIA